MRKARNSEAAGLGFRSLFVLAKLGFDMRKDYEHLLHEPLPDEISRWLRALAGEVVYLPQR